MLHPSYSELIDVVNSTAPEGEEPIISSRYSIVIAASKRARQIIDGDQPLVENPVGKALSVAVEEMNEAKVTIVSEDDTLVDGPEKSE